MNKFLTLSFASLMAFAGLADSLSNYGVIDYVKSTRTQYLVTDYYPNPKTWMEAVVGFSGTYRRIKTGETSNFFASAADSTSPYACYSLNIGDDTGTGCSTMYAYLYKGSDSGEAKRMGCHNYGASLTASTNTLVVQNGTPNSSVTWGGTAMTDTPPHTKTTTCSNPMAIFGKDGAAFAHYDFSVYSVKIYESDDGTKGGANEVLKHDFIPVTNNLGVAGLYDRVAAKFFYCTNGTPLVAGIILPTPTISGTLVMNGWESGETPSQPSGLTTDLGTLVYRYYTDSACTQAMATPTTATSAGTYYVRGEVDASASWNAAASASVSFTVTGTPVADLEWTKSQYTPATWTATATAANVLAGLEGTVGNKYTIWYTEGGKSLGNTTTLLTDGAVPGATVDYSKIAAIKTSGSTITWTFDAADVQEIRIYSRWSDGGRDGISISKVEIKQSGSDAFTDLNTSVSYGVNDKNSGGALQAVLARMDASPIAKSMTALRLTFGAQDNSGAGYVEIEAVRACDHVWGEPTVVEATCTTDGSITKTCSKCDIVNVTVLPLLGHDFDESGLCRRCHAWSLDERSAFLASLCTSANRVASSPVAKGGIIHKLGNDYIHIFTDVDKTTNFSVTNGDVVARMLLVAGGGAGGGSAGSAGGGAGGMVTNDAVALTEGTYTVTVGAGAPATQGCSSGANGGNSSVSNATAAVCTVAVGGGGGCAWADGSQTRSAGNGGSGGGRGAPKDSTSSTAVGTGIAGQGHNGGQHNGNARSGGGGGAGAAGGNATSSKGGAGGEGLASTILGSVQMFAGGGGGGIQGTSSNNGNVGVGGDGGGGTGGCGKWNVLGCNATAGTDGLGGGGGGSGPSGNASTTQKCYGAPGGCGLVVIRYTDPTKVGKVPAVTLSSVTPNDDATATIAWSMTGKDPLTLKAVYGCDSQNLNLTNTFTTTATAGEGSSTLGGLLPGRTYYLKLVAENEYGDSGFMVPVSFAMPEDGPMPTTPPAEMPIVGSKTVKDQTGGTTIDVVATLSQAGTGSSFADCTATVRWGTVNELAQMTSSKSASVASDGTVTISPDNLGTGTYYGCLEVVNANGYMDRLFFSFRAADTSTYQWKEGVTNGNWKDRDNWTGAPNDWCLGYPTDLATADFTSANCATVHVSGVINCAKMKMEKANATYVFIGDDATAAVYPATANTSGNQNYVTVPSGEELVFDGIKAYLLCGSSSCFRFDGSSKLVVRNGANVDVCRSGSIGTKESLELTGSEARLEVQGTGSRILTSNFKLAASNKATAGGTVVLSGASPSLNVTSVSSGSIFAQCFDATIVCEIPADGWANPVIPSTKLSKFAQGGNNSGSGKIIFTVPKTAPIRGAKDKTKTESTIVSCANGFEVSRITFGSTAKSSDYFYYTLGDAKYVYCTTDATKLAAIDAPDVALETQPAVTALMYHHEPAQGLLLIVR